MIITQTPLRISLFGGGTDFREYFEREGGCVLSSAIDKYVYVIIKERFDDLIRVGYTRTEMVERVDQVQHELVREALKLTGITKGVEIATMADIPSAGSGLGSSSSVTVGLLNAMHAYLGHSVTPRQLAAEACRIEIDILGKPIGVQDQYIAAYGNLRFMRFSRNGYISVRSVTLDESIKRRLNEHLLLLYTGISRQSSDVLTEQKANINERLEVLRALKQMALEAVNRLQAGDFDGVGELLHQSWLLKQQLASKVSNGIIDEMYAAARKAGALGGKITGAGGGGFLLLYCPRSRRDDVRATLHGLRELPFSLERDGSKVIFNYRR